MAFFIMTGLAIIVYLNQYPNQPRERDYAYVGSFYAFAIWIGLGFMFVYEQLQKYLGEKGSLAVTFVGLIAAVPVIMGSQNWDDHSRAGRYTARDIGANYLKSCDKNAVLFTYGDNDSFPVWYNQDVEGVRTDVRVANLSYIQAGWYIEMMRQKAYGSDPLPLTLGADKYVEGTREQLPVNNRIDKPINLKEIVQFVGYDDSKYKVDLSGRGDFVNYIPANKFIVDVDSAKVLSNGTVKSYYKDRLVSPMIWEYSDEDAMKGDLAIMDLISTNNWTRPIYYSTTVPSTQYKGLEKYFIQEGLAYRLVPIKTDKPEQGEFGMIDPLVMYDNMMNKFKWGNAESPSVYLDENNKRMFCNFRRIFGTLGNALLATGDTLKAVEVAHKGLEIVPAKKMPYDFFTVGIAGVLINAGKKEEGEKLLNDVIKYSKEYLDYAISLKPEDRYGLEYPTGINMQALLDIYNLAVKLKLTTITSAIEPEINNYYGKLYSTK